MKKFREREDAGSSVIGVILLVGLTVVMVSTIALSVFAFGAFETQPPAPQAKIEVVEAKGDMSKPLYKNTIVLKHKGGDMLIKNNTKIIITGKGYAYSTGSYPTPTPLAQDIWVIYRDLSGNNYGGESGNNLGEIVEGNTWDAGEQIKLYGKDGRNIGLIMNQGNTVDSKWKLETGSMVSVTIIDTTTDQVIAVSKATVKKT